MKRRLREPVSGLTHLVGGLLALVAMIVLLTKAAGRVDELVAFGIFGLSLVALYGASALYHRKAATNGRNSSCALSLDGSKSSWLPRLLGSLGDLGGVGYTNQSGNPQPFSWWYMCSTD